jgi:hypothetical protein
MAIENSGNQEPKPEGFIIDPAFAPLSRATLFKKVRGPLKIAVTLQRAVIALTFM